jgi:prevent-host-death family protein
MTEALVSQLKARLSAYLAAVRNGETVIVLDRKTPIAKLVPYDGSLEELRLKGASKAAGDLARIRPVRLLKPINLVDLLREDRDGR